MHDIFVILHTSAVISLVLLSWVGIVNTIAQPVVRRK